jgi:hypothetical protein
MPTNLLHISYKHFDIFTFQQDTKTTWWAKCANISTFD